MKHITILGLCLISICAQLKAQTDSLKILIGFSPSYTTQYTQESFKHDPLVQNGNSSGSQYRYEEPIVHDFFQVGMDVHALTGLGKHSMVTYGGSYVFQKYNATLDYIQNGRFGTQSESIKCSEVDLNIGFVRKVSIQNRLMVLPEFSGYINFYSWESESVSDYDINDDYFPYSTQSVYRNDIQVGVRLNVWVTYQIHKHVGLGLVWYNLLNAHGYSNANPNSTKNDNGFDFKINPLQSPRVSLLLYL